MNEFDNLIIAAFRDKNFKFAAEATDLDPEASALAILNDRLDATLKAKNYDDQLVTKIYQIFVSAKSFLYKKLDDTVGNALSYNRENNTLNLISTSDPNVDKFYQALMVKILERLGEPTSAPTSTSTITTSKDEENPFTLSNETDTSSDRLKKTKLIISIETTGETLKNYILLNTTYIGSHSAEGITINDIGAAAEHICLYKDLYSKWIVHAIQSKDTYLNGNPIPREPTEVKEKDIIYFSNTKVKIIKIENVIEDESLTSSASPSSSEGGWGPPSSNDSEKGSFFGGPSDNQSEQSSTGGFSGFGGRRR